MHDACASSRLGCGAQPLGGPGHAGALFGPRRAPIARGAVSSFARVQCCLERGQMPRAHDAGAGSKSNKRQTAWYTPINTTKV